MEFDKKNSANNCNKHENQQNLPQSKAAYWEQRSTTDIIRVHCFIIAKVMFKDLKIQTTGFNMSSAVDIINKEKLMETLGGILEEDKKESVDWKCYD